MTCVDCNIECKRFGKNRNGSQRYRCPKCNRTFSDAPENRMDGFYLPAEKIAQVVRLLVEGCSVRAIERIAGIHRDTVLKVLVMAGEKCES